MLAKRLGAHRVMALINKPAYAELIESGTIDVAISPQTVTIGSLLAHVRRGDVVQVHSLRRGAAEAIEAVVHGTPRRQGRRPRRRGHPAAGGRDDHRASCAATRDHGASRHRDRDRRPRDPVPRRPAPHRAGRAAVPVLTDAGSRPRPGLDADAVRVAYLLPMATSLIYADGDARRLRRRRADLPGCRRAAVVRDAAQQARAAVARRVPAGEPELGADVRDRHRAAADGHSRPELHRRVLRDHVGPEHDRGDGAGRDSTTCRRRSTCGVTRSAGSAAWASSCWWSRSCRCSASAACSSTRPRRRVPIKNEKLTPRITQTAKALWFIYFLITVACILSLKVAGMDWFDAVCHAFSAMSLGGFSTHDASVGYFDSVADRDGADRVHADRGDEFRHALHRLAAEEPAHLRDRRRGEGDARDHRR